MSQPSVTAYFNTRKRQATEDLRNKAKVLLLDREQTGARQGGTPIYKDSSETLASTQKESAMRPSPKKLVTGHGKESMGNRTMKPNSAVRNIQFDSPKTNSEKTTKVTRARATRSRKPSGQDGQDIRESFQKIADELNKKVVFEKKGTLSRRKSTPKKDESAGESCTSYSNEQLSTNCTTPKKGSAMDALARQDMSLTEIKNRINKSSRLMELKASIARFRNCEQKLDQLQKEKDTKKPQIQKFEKIQLEIPVSPQKGYRSPSKTVLSPLKNGQLENVSPQRRILFEPKESTPSPVKSSPTKAPAYQQYLSLAESGTPALPLPYHYRFLAEAFRCVDTISSMLFNRKETITFKKLKPSVQELLRKNFNLEHLAQIKTIFPEAYTFNQEKFRSFGSTSKQDTYELILKPVVENENDGRDTPDSNDILKSGSETSMGPRVLLDRRRKFYNTLVDRVKDEHEKFLLSLETPMRVPKEKVVRWHPEFDVESCKPIEQAELPQPPNVEKLTTAKDVLDKAKSLFNCATRMERGLQLLADAKMTSQSSPESAKVNDSTQTDGMRKVNITVVDTPPATPTVHSNLTSTLKGIPKALLEKVRARQAAKALEAMTRPSDAQKEAVMYSRLPEMVKVLRNIFVAEKKGVLTLEYVITKLENSYRAKLTPAELEEHIRLLCKLLPMWTSIHHVRKIDYLKLQRETDLAKVVKRLEILANSKVKSS